MAIEKQWVSQTNHLRIHACIHAWGHIDSSIHAFIQVVEGVSLWGTVGNRKKHGVEQEGQHGNNMEGPRESMTSESSLIIPARQAFDSPHIMP